MARQRPKGSPLGKGELAAKLTEGMRKNFCCFFTALAKAGVRAKQARAVRNPPAYARLSPLAGVVPSILVKAR